MAKAVNKYVPGARPYSVACFNSSPSFVIGCELKGLEIVQVNETGLESVWTSHPPETQEPSLTVDAVDVNTRNAVVYAHNEQVSIIHPTAAVQTRTAKSYDVDGFVSALKVSKYNPDVVAVGTDNGSIQIIDLRERMAADPKVYTNCHKRKVFKKDVSVATSALDWLDPHTLVSGGAFNSECKFWDIRKPRKSPFQTTPTPSSVSTVSTVSTVSGVRSIVCNETVYALTNEVTQFNAAATPVSTYAPPDLVVDSKYTEMDLTSEGLAVGGKNGLSYLDFSAKSWCLCPSNDPVTAVKFHRHCDKIVAISGNSIDLYSLSAVPC